MVFPSLSSDYKIIWLYFSGIVSASTPLGCGVRQSWSRKWKGGRLRTSVKITEADLSYPEVALASTQLRGAEGPGSHAGCGRLSAGVLRALPAHP